MIPAILWLSVYLLDLSTKNVFAIALPLGTSLNTNAISFCSKGSFCLLEYFLISPSVDTNLELTTMYFPFSSISFSCAFPFL